MTFADWLTLATFCLLGAISPGPSLAVVLRHTVQGSRRLGMATAVAHGAGVGVYALAAALGLAQLTQNFPQVYKLFTYAGAAYLLFLAVQMWLSPVYQAKSNSAAASTSLSSAMRDGFLIVFLNPKIIIWLAALFSQFMRPEQGLSAGLILAGTTWIIDSAWYVLVAFGLSTSQILPWIKAHSIWINRASALILVLLAVRVITQT